MSKKIDYSTAIRESMDLIDEFWTPRSEPKDFGKKGEPEPTDDEIEASAGRRLKDVTGRANAEKKSYGFLRSLKNKVFGNKNSEPKPEFKRPERSEDERRQAIINRAKNS